MRKDSKVRSMIFQVDLRIEDVREFLKSGAKGDKILKSKISLLSALLEVKKKLRLELKEVEKESKKSPRSLRDLVNVHDGKK